VVAGLERLDAPSLFDELCRALANSGFSGVTRQDLLGFDLCLFDVQKGTLAGGDREFLFSARLDNLTSCHAGLSALLSARGDARKTRGIALFDHEEVGSQSATGARAPLLESVLERLALGAPNAKPDAMSRALARSLLVSADMAHGVHPNYPDKHDKQHRPLLGGGPVIKVNANQSYATDSVGAARFTQACRAVGVEPQHFVSRNDMGCGSTIGPISAARLGVRTVDVGSAMLSMHSCREMASSTDVSPMIRVLTELFLSDG
jgi:aspartyl aminopeptidase